MKAVEELTPSVGISVACDAIGVPRATAYRHRLPKAAVAPKSRPAPPRALSGEERKRVLDVLHGEAFADKAPAETYAKLLDQGTYLCSIRTMYRVLEANQEVRERRNQGRITGPVCRLCRRDGLRLFYPLHGKTGRVLSAQASS